MKNGLKSVLILFPHTCPNCNQQHQEKIVKLTGRETDVEHESIIQTSMICGECSYDVYGHEKEAFIREFCQESSNR